jgi:hypothetical protein
VNPSGLDLPAVAGVLAARDRDRHHGRAALQRQPADATLGLGQRPGADPRALREDHHGLAALEQRQGGCDRFLVRLAATHREGAHAVQKPADQRIAEQLLLCHEVDRPRVAAADREGVEEAAVVGGEDHAAGGDVLAPEPAQAEVEKDRRLDHCPHKPVDERVHPSAARPLVVERERTRPQQALLVLLRHRHELPRSARGVTLRW